eukprot:TRINITY_DN12103_c0_g1_i6.p1 TRINITY_DN12103_c0_g1~~TRINITY_DN12103_c0_g1_i6.p1  ORF type:complete len:954 (-),score=221.58 TRINITY_DN12103_c0_g1_i6:488-3349(-)
MFGRGKKKPYDPTRENLIKTKILDSLAESVKVIQSEKKHADEPLGLVDSTARLCSVLEAMFIHGLKSTFLGRFPLWGGGDFSPRLPEPSFWTFALLYSHKQVISSIEKSTQITTEVGKARAWLRLALNDGLLVSYLQSMARDKGSVSVHYEVHAMLRDTDRMDLVRSYITGLEIYSFDLPTNVSMFNRWLPEPLTLAGVWESSSTVQPITDTSCIDAAAQVDEQEESAISGIGGESSQPCLIRSLAQPIQNNSLVQLGLLNEDEALRLILQSTPVSLPCSPPVPAQPPLPPSTQSSSCYPPPTGASSATDANQIVKSFNDDTSDPSTALPSLLETNWTEQDFSSRRFLSSEKVASRVSSKSGSNSRLASPCRSSNSSRNLSPLAQHTASGGRRQSLSPVKRNAEKSREASQDRSMAIRGQTEPDNAQLMASVRNISLEKSTSPPPTKEPKKSPSEPLLDIYMQRSSVSPEPSTMKLPKSETHSRSPSREELRVHYDGRKEIELQNENRSDSYTISHSSSPCRPSATPSMEWEEEFQGPGVLQYQHQPDSLELELQRAQDLEQAQQELKIQQGQDLDLTAEQSTQQPGGGGEEEEEDSIASNSLGSDKSCTCSTQGPVPDCRLCSSLNLNPVSRIQLSEYVEPDLASTDQISLEGERKRRRQSFKIGFRKIPDISIPDLSLQRNLDLVSCLDIIPRELGMHTQDWRCIDCTKAIGALFGNGKVCAFTKKHYCEECHVDDMATIPSRLIYNWDAKQYPVARSSFRFLELAKSIPFIKLREFNPKLGGFVPSIEGIMAQRKKLHYMHAYLTACSRAGDQLDKLAAIVSVGGGGGGGSNREHLYTDTEMFSVQDVAGIQSGELASVLRLCIDVCEKHITSCLVCSGRGFICEICKDKRPVYPYNLDSTSQCGDCFTVFHSTCAKTLVQCPRCERISSRELNSLITETKLRRELRETD